jgi:hypothetical protein
MTGFFLDDEYGFLIAVAREIEKVEGVLLADDGWVVMAESVAGDDEDSSCLGWMVSVMLILQAVGVVVASTADASWKGGEFAVKSINTGCLLSPVIMATEGKIRNDLTKAKGDESFDDAARCCRSFWRAIKVLPAWRACLKSCTTLSPTSHKLGGFIQYLHTSPIAPYYTTTMSKSSLLRTGKELLRLLKTPRPSKELAMKVEKRGIDPRRRSQNPIIQFVSQQLRTPHAAPTSSNAAAVAGNLLRDFHRLRSDLAERARLQEMDTGAEEVLTPKEMSRRAAARAGLQLPKLDESLS